MRVYNKGTSHFSFIVDRILYQIPSGQTIQLGNHEEQTVRRILNSHPDVILLDADQMYFHEQDLNGNGILDQIENFSLGFSSTSLDTLIFGEEYPEPTTILDSNASGADLQDAINNASPMDIIRIDNSNVFTPVVFPTNKPLAVYGNPSYQPIVDGGGSSPYCMSLVDGCHTIYVDNFKLVDQSGSNTAGAIDNAGAFCLQSPALVKNIILKGLDVYNCTEAGIQFQRMASVTGTPSSLEDLCRGIYIINCILDTCSTADNTENGGIALYDVRDYMIIGCKSTNNLRGINAPNSVDGHIQGNRCWNNRDGGIKLDSVPSLSFPQAIATIMDNVSYGNGAEGIRLDDASRAYVINNTVMDNGAEGILIEDLSNESYIMNNISAGNTHGLVIEDNLTKAIAIYNNCYNNSVTDYSLGVNVVDSSSNMNINVDTDFVDKTNFDYTLKANSVMNRAGYKLMPLGSKHTSLTTVFDLKQAMALINTRMLMIYNDFKGLKRLDTEALEILFDPSVSGNWNSTPTQVQEALDELASRVKTLES